MSVSECKNCKIHKEEEENTTNINTKKSPLK